MSYFNLKFRVDFLGHVKNVKINIVFFTVYTVGFRGNLNRYYAFNRIILSYSP